MILQLTLTSARSSYQSVLPGRGLSQNGMYKDAFNVPRAKQADMSLFVVVFIRVFTLACSFEPPQWTSIPWNVANPSRRLLSSSSPSFSHSPRTCPYPGRILFERPARGPIACHSRPETLRRDFANCPIRKVGKVKPSQAQKALTWIRL